MIVKTHKTLFGRSGASFSDDMRHRYTLWRSWDVGPMLNYVLLNPSKADEQHDDPTVVRCQRRAAEMEFGGIIITNLFALRATDPADLRKAVDPVGQDNDDSIRESVSQSKMVICGWGSHGGYLKRDDCVLALLREANPHKLYCLRRTRAGRPQHPLYLPYDLTPLKL